MQLPVLPRDGGMVVRQSDLKNWQKCPLIWRYQHIDKLPRMQSGSLTYGSIIHDCVYFLETTRDLPGAIARFYAFWDTPTALDPEYKIDYFVRGTNWKKYYELGPAILRHWWNIIQWDADAVIAREHEFDVPIGDGHVLHGTADKVTIRYNAKVGGRVLLISDYKTNNKKPTYDYLAEDLQFTAYAYASTRPEFWAGLPNGEALFADVAQLPRYGEWVALTEPKRLDAGVRTQRHYNRLIGAVNALALSVAMRIFVPTVSGESCRWCDYRTPCGLPALDDDGNEIETPV